MLKEKKEKKVIRRVWDYAACIYLVGSTAKEVKSVLFYKRKLVLFSLDSSPYVLPAGFNLEDVLLT